MLNDLWHRLLQNTAPQHTASRLMGKLVQCEIPQVKDYLIRKFIRRYGVNMQEAERSNPEDYVHFNDFFTRHLKAGTRPINCDADSIISPVDGSVSQVGRIKQGRIIQAKGFDFTASELLGGGEATDFDNGHFATLYLSPKDYHRVHMPFEGTLRQMSYIPGKLFSVSPRTASTIPRLFARNERVACLFDTPKGPMAVVLVGAFFVASMSTVWAGDITPNHDKDIHHRHYDHHEHQIHLDRAQEMGHFKLGSTVILMYGPDMVQWASDIKPDCKIRMGQLLGTLQK